MRSASIYTFPQVTRVSYFVHVFFSYNNQSVSQFRASRRGASCVFESNIDIALDKIFLARATTCTPISRSRNFSRASQLLMYHGYSSPDLENNRFRHKKYLPLHKELPRLKYQVSLQSFLLQNLHHAFPT